MTYGHKATARFIPTAWEEPLIHDIDGSGTRTGDAYYPDRGLTRVEATYSYRGDIEGTSSVSSLISYRPGSAPVLGFERFEGSIDGHEGSCVFRQVGTHDAESVSLHLDVVPGLGTGGLETLRGEAQVELAGHSDEGYELTLAYDLG